MEDYIKNNFKYDSETGLLFRLKYGKWIECGSKVFKNNKPHYMKVWCQTRMQQVHRLAWTCYYGKLPDRFIDHIDGDTHNNKINNLREATNQENLLNRDKTQFNNTGYKGVSFNKNKQKYEAQLTLNYIRYHLGYYRTAEEASAVYEAKAKEAHKEFYYKNE